MFKTISEGSWSLTVDLNGGRIKELCYDKKIILGSFSRIDGKTGTTHLCIPNFADEGTSVYDLPFHGLVRDVSWNVRDDKKNVLTILCKTSSTDKYPAELYVEQKFELIKNSFRQTVVVENGGGASAPVNIGIHNYFNAVEGWEGIKINGIDITEKAKSNGFILLRHNNRLVFPGGISYKLRVKNFDHAVLWSARKSSLYDMSYLCIEPVKQYKEGFFGSKESFLAVGKTYSVMQEISV
ncbi:MAG: hypothetical protein WC489_03425 [Patescibacteria group bacterium]